MQYGPSLALTRPRRLFGGGVPDLLPVDLDNISSQSIRFPQINTQDSSENPGGACLVFQPGTNRVLSPTHGGAMYGRIEIPWEVHYRPSDASTILIGSTNISSPRRILLTMKMAGQTNEYVISFAFDGDSSGDLTMSGSLPAIPKTTRRVLWAFWSEINTNNFPHGGLWDCDTGSQIGSTVSLDDSGGGGLLWLGARQFSGRYLGVGGQVHDTNGTYVDTRNTAISMDLFGIYDNGASAGSARSESDFASLALGADPVTVFGSNKHLVLRQWSDPSDLNTVPTNGEWGAGLTFSVVSTGGYTLQKGGTIGRQSSSEYLLVDYIREGKVFPVEPFETSATFSLSGKTSLADGQEIECRVFSQRDGTVAMDWTSVATVSSNTFTASITCPVTKGWGYFEFRAASDPENTNLQHITRRPMGVGYGIRLIGQSQVTIATGTAAQAAASSYTADLSVSDIGNAAYSISRALDVDTDQFETTFVVNEQCMPQSDSVLSYGWTLDQHGIDAPFEFIVHAKQSTSQIQWVDDSNSGRNWTVDEDISSYFGADFTAAYKDWITSIAANASSDMETKILDEVIMGTTAGTGPTINGSGYSYVRNHSIYGNSKDDAVFNVTTRSPIIIVGEGTRHATETPHSPISDTSEPAGAETNLTQYRLLRQHIRSFIANNSVAYEGVPTIDIGIAAAGGAHQNDTPYGKMRIAIRWMESILKGLGLATFNVPEIQDSLVRSGDTITVTIDMKSMGDLVVGTDLTGVSVPAGYPALTGWEVSEDGGSTWSLSGFTASITSTSGTVELVRDSGNWPANTQVRYAFGGPATRDTGSDDEVNGLLYADTGVNTSTDLGKAKAGILVRGPAGPFTAA